MSRLTDKLAVLLLCVTAFSFSELSAVPVVGFLISVAATSAVWLISGTTAASVTILVCAMACIPFPVIFCAAPIMLYDALGERRPWLAAPALLAMVNASEFSTPQLSVIFAGVAVTAAFSLRVNSLEDTVGTLNSLRDEVEEKNLQLQSKNVSLADAQDNEVHLAMLRERNRIAREIHDNVGHMLTRSLLQAGALMVINKDENMKQPLSDLKDTLNTAMTSIRESVHDLHDESIDFDSAVKESIRSVEDRFAVTFDSDCDGAMPVKIRLCFLAVIKEGLSNAVKHSRGDRIRITVRQHPAFYQLTVEDNGPCSGTAPKSTGGIGLQNMRDRAAALDGMISFTPSQEGFRIFLTVRLDAAKALNKE